MEPLQIPSSEDPASLFQRGINCGAVARAQRLAFLVDGEAYFSAFRRAALAAERSIIIVAWDFDSGTLLDPRHDPTRIGEFLNELAKRRRRLHIRILDWDYPVIFGADRELSPVYGLSWKPHRRVHFRYDNTHPIGGSHHQKIAVIDDKLAFVGGLDLACKRWDTPAHDPADPHRVTNGKPYPPFHDLMVAVDGEAASVLSSIVRTRWKDATGEAVAPAGPTRSDPWPDALAADLTEIDVAIACTEPQANGRSGVRHVEQLYLDMIAAARRYIYIENQYFTSHLIGRALGARLAEPDGPEIVLVTRLLSHGWLEEMTMHVLRTRLIRELRAADRYRRFQVYYPHLDGLTDGTCIDVHSKMMAVDDEWLRIGSSNLSNRSMGLDLECDVAIEARGEQRIARAIRSFRDRLLAEHLVVQPQEVADAEARAGTLIGAIAALQTPGRSLRALEELRDWPDALVEAIAITDPERPVSLDGLLGQLAPGEAPQPRRRPLRTVLVVLACFAAFALAWQYTPLAQWITVDRIAAFAEDFGSRWWAPLAVVLAYTPASLVLFPRPLITLAATVAFGPLLAFVYGMLGILLAGALTFGAGRLLKRDTVRRLAGERLNRLTDMLRKHGLPAVIAVRFLPVAPFSVVNMVAGAIRIKLWQFLVGTGVGILPGVLAATLFGEQFGAALKDPGTLNVWMLVGIAVFFVAVFAAARLWLSRVHRRDAAAKAAVMAERHENAPADAQRGGGSAPRPRRAEYVKDYVNT